MTEQEARIVVLEDTLREAQSLVEFLHMCLVKPSNGEMNGGYRYAYPEHTIERLKEWNGIAPRGQSCHHSRVEKDCKSCQRIHIERMQLWEAHKVLGNNIENDIGIIPLATVAVGGVKD